jgi:hypothetical protein
MFKRFFSALANLTASVETLTASVQEANDNFRANLGMDEPNDQPDQLEHDATATKTKRRARP